MSSATPHAGRWTLGVSTITGLVLLVGAFLVYVACAERYASGRGDLFYLADAFLHGRTWLDHALGPQDVIVLDGRVYVPFGPFPAIALMPLVGLLGAAGANALEPAIDGGLAAASVGLVWVLAGRLGVRRPLERTLLGVLAGFSTPILWITTRGGVWHTGQLVATVLTLLALLEVTGRRRPLVLGALAGAAFLSRAPLLLAVPFYVWAAATPDVRGRLTGRLPLRAWSVPAEEARRWLRAAGLVALGLSPSLVFFLWYDAARFGSPLESGYGLAALPPFLEAQREQGLFSLVHVPMNLDYLLLHVPRRIDQFPYLEPDGLGMSILLTSPGLLLAAWAPWRSRLAPALGLTALLVLVPTLLYYGGGWVQFGYRYALDSIPFVIALAALAVARIGVAAGGRLLIALGVLVNAVGVYWAYVL